MRGAPIRPAATGHQTIETVASALHRGLDALDDLSGIDSRAYARRPAPPAAGNGANAGRGSFVSGRPMVTPAPIAPASRMLAGEVSPVSFAIVKVEGKDAWVVSDGTVAAMCNNEDLAKRICAGLNGGHTWKAGP